MLIYMCLGCQLVQKAVSTAVVAGRCACASKGGICELQSNDKVSQVLLIQTYHTQFLPAKC